MGKPTSEELQHALSAAGKMREDGEDPDFIAKSLLSINYRFDKSVHVITLLKRYLHSGASGTEHSKLLKALQEFEKVEGATEHTNFGLN